MTKVKGPTNRFSVRFKCNFKGCDKVFTRLLYIENHIRIHNGERPFICNFCGMSFTQTGNLNKHLQNIHKKTSRQNAGQKVSFNN